MQLQRRPISCCLLCMIGFPNCFAFLYFNVNQETEDDHKTKILVITAIVVAVTAGVLIVSYCIHKKCIYKSRANTEGNDILFASKLLFCGDL